MKKLFLFLVVACVVAVGIARSSEKPVTRSYMSPDGMQCYETVDKGLKMIVCEKEVAVKT